jgi:hypothetical protein
MNNFLSVWLLRTTDSENELTAIVTSSIVARHGAGRLSVIEIVRWYRQILYGG